MNQQNLKQRAFFKASLLLIILLTNPIQTFAQPGFQSSPSILGQGDTGSTTSGISSILSNPAGIHTIKSTSVSANYYAPYMITELSTQSLSVAVPLSFGTPYGSIKRFGFDKYNETTFAVGLTRQIAPTLSMNFQLNLQHNQIVESGNSTQVFSSFGVQFAPHQQVIAAFHITNPEKATIKTREETETIPSIYTLGIRWQSNPRFSVAYEIIKQTNYKTTNCFGCEYHTNNFFIARIGAFGKPMNYTLGVGFILNNITIDACAVNHQTLGISSGLGLTYNFNQKQ